MPVTATTIPNIRQIAAEELDRADGAVERATAAMQRRVLNDHALFRALMTPLVHGACYNEITSVCRAARAVIWRNTQPSAEEGRRVIELTGRATARVLMNFQLPGGLRLGDATKSQVQEAAQFYLNQGNDMLIKGRWLQLINNAMPRNTTVASALTEQRLWALRRNAENA